MLLAGLLSHLTLRKTDMNLVIMINKISGQTRYMNRNHDEYKNLILGQYFIYGFSKNHPLKNEFYAQYTYTWYDI